VTNKINKLSSLIDRLPQKKRKMTTNVKFSKANIAQKEIETSRTCKELKHYAMSYGDSYLFHVRHSFEDPNNLKALIFFAHPHLVWQAIL
jgi:hypothetical protein